MHYKNIALLIRKDSEYPEYIELTDTDSISALLDNSPSFIYTFNGNGYKMYQSIWEPISKYLEEGETVYFSASGILHQINLSAIPASDEKTIGDLYNLVQLSSTREIALQRSGKINKSAVIYGGFIMMKMPMPWPSKAESMTALTSLPLVPFPMIQPVSV